MKKRAFTLAEIMIVLTVIGILTAIILPSARNLMPDKALMKFKKAHNTLGTVITELVNSDKYYLDGDLGVKPNSDLIDGTHDGDKTYLCQTMADIINAKKFNCKDSDTAATGYRWDMLSGGMFTEGSIDVVMENFDTACMRQALEIGKDGEIITSDNVHYYQTAPGVTFGMTAAQAGNASCSDEGCNQRLFLNLGYDGYLRVYKIYCIDIDGVPDSATKYDCVNECPFGYGIRTDGKIISGARAVQWLEREVTQKD